MVQDNQVAEQLFTGNSEMAMRMRAFDWSQTPLGRVETWSPTLCMMVRFLLVNRFPLILWWGPHYIQFYNDPYCPIPGTKHPKSIGQPASECWSEIWHIIGPLIDRPFQGGPATWMEDIFLEVNRHGFVEETHFTIAYSPVPDETAPRGIGGVLGTVHEITEKVIGERRLMILHELSARGFEAKTKEESCTIAAETLLKHPQDVPFALFYLVGSDGKQAQLSGVAGISLGEQISPQVVNLDEDDIHPESWPLTRAMQTGTMQVVEYLGSRFPWVPLGPWKDPPHTAVVLPIFSSKAHRCAGLLIIGISSRLRFDESYRSFLELMTTQIATAIANAQSYEEERKRAEALFELDRAKTVFFSNVSHEFRTPLTLMLNPLKELSNQLYDRLQSEEREQLQLVQRNGLRLQKLVNTLLDFSCIEAGRVQASYEATDLACYTAELASVFRSLIEQAKMRLAIDCPPLPEAVYIDREMWEKIVLNLLSNAFKFTFAGEISVRLRWQNDHVELAVQDTGIGIPASELPQLFERFHRVKGAQGRSFEGSGIGLSLVQELVKLHGGTIEVASVAGAGTCFTVSIPTGTAHLPQDRISAPRTLTSTALSTDAYLEEALRWLPESQQDGGIVFGDGELCSPSLRSDLSSAKILVADDNADMRDYVRRLLSQQYEVEAVSDGLAALSAIRQQVPDLVLTDVMMPNLDGFGLLQELRSHPDTRGIPIILLSARSGEEARAEGLSAGADDYLIKPFSARELLARVEATLKLARLRREANAALHRSEEQFRLFVTASSDMVYRMSADWSVMLNLEGKDSLASTENPNRSWLEQYIPQTDHPQVLAAIQEAIRTKSVFELEHRVIQLDGTVGWTFSRAIPLLDAENEIIEWFGAASDVTERKQAEVALRRSQEMFSALVADAPFGVYVIDAEFRFQQINKSVIAAFKVQPLIGRDLAEVLRITWQEPFATEAIDRFRHTLATGESYYSTLIVEPRADIEEIQSYDWQIHRVTLPDGSYGVVCYFYDLSEIKRAEEIIRRNANRDAFLVALNDAMRSLTNPIEIQAAAARVLGEHLAVSRAFYVEVEREADGDYYIVKQDYCAPNILSHAGRFRRDDFGETIFSELRAGRTLAVTNIETEPRLSEAERVRYVALDIRAYVGVPLVKNGRNVAVLGVYQTTARAWTNEEIALIEETADRTWAAVERARVEAEREQLLVREQAAREAAQSANRIKDEFLAVLSHELRSPLNPILGWSKLLRTGNLNPTKTAQAITTIERNANLQSELIEDLLDVSRILQGKLRLNVSPTNLTTTIRGALETVRLAAEAKSITVETDLDPKVGQVSGDSTRLHQVVWNLLSNAVKFTPAEGRVLVRLQQIDGQAQIAVSDNGKGISADFLPHVFDYFRQEDGATTRKFGGLGLGLAIVKQIVELHGGMIQVESRGEGLGATFTVRLPLMPIQPAIKREQSSAERSLNLEGIRVLIIDDEPDSREFVAFVLEEAGASVTTASTASEGFLMLTRLLPDVLLSDIGMPDMDGYMLMQQIRSLPPEQGGQVKVIALTAYAGDFNEQQALQAGFQQHLTKPIDPEQLVKAVSTHL